MSGPLSIWTKPNKGYPLSLSLSLSLSLPLCLDYWLPPLLLMLQLHSLYHWTRLGLRVLDLICVLFRQATQGMNGQRQTQRLAG